MHTSSPTLLHRSRRLPAVHSGFTLIELLVVIAIISLLVAIFFPVFARVRDNARRSACQSNLKQIGLGLIQYAQDYDEHFPGDQNDSRSWMENVQPYIKSGQVFSCPSNWQNKVAFAGSVPPLTVSYGCAYIDDGLATGTRSFGVIGRGQGGVTPPYIGYPGTLVGQVFDPTQCIMVGEQTRAHDYLDPTDNLNQAISDGGTTAGCGGSDRTGSCYFAGHAGKSNFLFVDGHVKPMDGLSTLNQVAGPTQKGNMWYYSGQGMDAANLAIAKSVLGKGYGAP